MNWLRGGVVQWVARLTRNWSVTPIKGSHYFLEQETLPSLLSTGWFQGWIWVWFLNWTKRNWGPYGRLTYTGYVKYKWNISQILSKPKKHKLTFIWIVSVYVTLLTNHLYFVMLQLSYHPGHDDLVGKIINQAFKHFKYKDG